MPSLGRAVSSKPGPTSCPHCMIALPARTDRLHDPMLAVSSPHI
jgi:hypothetical protein